MNETPSTDAVSTAPLPLLPPAEMLTAFQSLNLLNATDQQSRLTLEEAWPQFNRLYETLVAVNTHTNLTRLTDYETYCARHILDSCLLLPYLKDGFRVADVGSGAGFPAFPLTIFAPEIQVMAIESVGKKAKFIEETSAKLGLEKRLRSVPQRSEVLCAHQVAEAAKAKGLTSFREAFDVACARAVSALPLLLELCLPLVKVGGHFLALKGPKVDGELENAQTVLKGLGGKVVAVERFGDLPILQGSVLVVIEKVAPTPKAYPRPTAQIKKKMLS
jgi:16S rRNA (guanine527-N7)-methyltransferase